jgi:hypothetical protein
MVSVSPQIDLVLDAVQLILMVILILLAASLRKAAVDLHRSLLAVLQRPAVLLTHRATPTSPEEQAAMLSAIDERLSQLSLQEILDAVTAKRGSGQ